MPSRALIIAGPNGAGKTTFAKEFLPAEGNCLRFINADLIAKGLSPFQPESVAFEASRIMLLKLIKQLIEEMILRLKQHLRVNPIYK